MGLAGDRRASVLSSQDVSCTAGLVSSAASELVTGEAQGGSKLHAVIADGVHDGQWTTALCGADVITYTGVAFVPNSWSSCKQCSKAAAKL